MMSSRDEIELYFAANHLADFDNRCTYMSPAESVTTRTFQSGRSGSSLANIQKIFASHDQFDVVIGKNSLKVPTRRLSWQHPIVGFDEYDLGVAHPFYVGAKEVRLEALDVDLHKKQLTFGLMSLDNTVDGADVYIPITGPLRGHGPVLATVSSERNGSAI
jgi:hypothetical protein